MVRRSEVRLLVRSTQIFSGFLWRKIEDCETWNLGILSRFCRSYDVKGTSLAGHSQSPLRYKKRDRLMLHSPISEKFVAALWEALFDKKAFELITLWSELTYGNSFRRRNDPLGVMQHYLRNSCIFTAYWRMLDSSDTKQLSHSERLLEVAINKYSYFGSVGTLSRQHRSDHTVKVIRSITGDDGHWNLHSFAAR